MSAPVAETPRRDAGPLVVGVSASSRAAHLVTRAAAKVPAGQRWFAVHIETATDARMSPTEHSLLARNLNLAEQLGAETVILPAVDSAGELLRFAEQHQATQIVVGKPRHPWWSYWLGRLSVDDLARRGEIDICILADADEDQPPAPRTAGPSQRKLLRYLSAVALVALCTIVNAFAIQPYLPLRNVVMVYLLGVTVAAMSFGRGPSALAAILSVMTFDFTFVSPTGSFGPSTTTDVITFGVMLAIGLTISTLTGHLSFQVRAARQREQRMSALFAMSREFATKRSRDEIAVAAEHHISDALGGEAAVQLVDDQGRRTEVFRPTPPLQWARDERDVVDWVVRNNRSAGAGTSNYSQDFVTYLPLSATGGCLGVLRVRLPRREPSPEGWDLLKTLTSLTAMAIERARWVEAAERARLDTEAERLRNSLLSAVSHDLRTPLAAIVGSSSTLVELGEHLGVQERRELAESILDEGERLNRQVANLLDMTRLENGSVEVHKEWQPVEEAVGVVLERLGRLLKAFVVEMRLEPGLPPVPMDERLIQQVLVNLLENAIKYSPPGTVITLGARREGEFVVVEVADRGPGMSPADLERAFHRFYRSATAAKGAGVGLGLAICRGIVSLHRGRIEAHNRPEGGLAVRFYLPLRAKPRTSAAVGSLPAEAPGKGPANVAGNQESARQRVEDTAAHVG